MLLRTSDHSWSAPTCSKSPVFRRGTPPARCRTRVPSFSAKQRGSLGVLHFVDLRSRSRSILFFVHYGPSISRFVAEIRSGVRVFTVWAWS